MNQFTYKSFYRRNLPHVQPEGAVLFVTFRLANSLPVEVVERLLSEKEMNLKSLFATADSEERERRINNLNQESFEKWDKYLDSCTSEAFLSDPRVADLVSESLHYRDKKVFDLISFSIMPNHVHLVMSPMEDNQGKYLSLSTIMHSLKRHTARQANILLNRVGNFWQHENYDHYVRDESELNRIMQYVLNNPVKAGLVKNWKDWRWSYCQYEM